MTLLDLIEIGGSLLILSSFAGVQMGRLDARSLPYLIFNLVGAAVLAVIALNHKSWGFLLLEGTWAVVSGISLLSVLRQRATPPSREHAR